MIDAEGQRLVEKIDDPAWAKQHHELISFLGFGQLEAGRALVKMFGNAWRVFDL